MTTDADLRCTILDTVAERLRDAHDKAPIQAVPMLTAAGIDPARSGQDCRATAASSGKGVRRVRYEQPHVSLYASPGTLKLIKQTALDEDTTAQALYREGLLRMLQARGLYRGKTVADI